MAHSAGQEWTVQDELAAAGVEVGHANWLMLRALAGDKTVRDAKPFRVQHPSRPGEQAPKPRRVSMTELMQQQEEVKR